MSGDSFKPRCRRVLDGARLGPGDVVLVDGMFSPPLLIEAIDRIGAEGELITLTEWGAKLEQLEALHLNPGMWYLLGDVEVVPLPDATVDAVLTHMVLLDSGDRAAAARECFRVLRSRGRLSIFELVPRYSDRLTELVDFGPAADRLAGRLHEIGDDGFDEHELAGWFVEAGFADVDWELVRDEQELSLHPIGEALVAFGIELTPGEAEQLDDAFRTQGAVRVRSAGVFLTAVKP